MARNSQPRRKTPRTSSSSLGYLLRPTRKRSEREREREGARESRARPFTSLAVLEQCPPHEPPPLVLGSPSRINIKPRKPCWHNNNHTSTTPAAAAVPYSPRQHNAGQNHARSSCKLCQRRRISSHRSSRGLDDARSPRPRHARPRVPNRPQSRADSRNYRSHRSRRTTASTDPHHLNAHSAPWSRCILPPLRHKASAPISDSNSSTSRKWNTRLPCCLQRFQHYARFPSTHLHTRNRNPANAANRL